MNAPVGAAATSTPPPSSPRGHRWVATVAELATAYRDLAAGGPVPVLRPRSADRARRWAQVLDWYGVHGMPVPTASAGDLLVCVTPEFWPAVAAHARATGRDAVRFDVGVTPLPDVLRTAASVTVIGRNLDLRMAELQRLAGVLGCPWGILPAADVAGLSFVLAKLLADTVAQPWHGRPRWALVDAINGRAHTHTDPEATDLDAERTVELLTVRDWDVLALCAHGENGHCNLDSHVLCGLVHEVETTADGTVLRGCSDVDGVRVCKRRRGDAGVLRARDIRARHLLLFSCTNFSVAGDLFPSTVSLVVSALEGYAASVLSCDRALPLNLPAARSLLALAVAGAAPGALREIENDHHARHSGAHPYFLAGDPRGDPARPRELTPATAATPQGSPPVLLGRWPADDDMVHLDPPGTAAVRGRWLLRAVAEPDTAVRVRSAAEALHRHRAWARNTAIRLADAARVTRAVRDFAPGEALPRVETALRAAERLAQGVARTEEAAVRAGIWNRALDQVPAIARRVDGDWDLALADSLASGLLQHNGFEQVLVDGLRLSSSTPAGPCDYCGSPAYRAVHTGDQPGGGMEFTHCPHCGPRHCAPPGMPDARIELSERILPGVPVRLRLLAPPELAGARLVAQFKDNGRNELWWRHEGVLAAGETGFEPVPPAESGADMFTLRVIMVCGLRISYHRLRRPCLASR